MERGRKEGGENRKNSGRGFVLILYIIITQTKAAAFVTDQDNYHLLPKNVLLSSGRFRPSPQQKKLLADSFLTQFLIRRLPPPLLVFPT